MKNKAYLWILVLCLGLLPGCGAAAPAGQTAETTAEAPAAETPETTGGSIDLDSLKTLGDAFAIEGKDEYSEQNSVSENKYAYGFTVDGESYRVVADLPDGLFDQIMALDFDDNYEENERKLVSDLEIQSAEYLNDQILSQEELDALVGKTGQELFDAGWRSGMFYNTETLEVWLEYGAFTYDMHFDGEIPPEEAESFDVYEDLADKKVLDATFVGVGDMTYME